MLSNLFWPKPKRIILTRPKPIVNVTRTISCSTELSACGNTWLGDVHRKPPPPLLPPPPPPYRCHRRHSNRQPLPSPGLSPSLSPVSTLPRVKYSTLQDDCGLDIHHLEKDLTWETIEKRTQIRKRENQAWMEGSLNQEVLVISEKNLEEKTDTEMGILLKSIP